MIRETNLDAMNDFERLEKIVGRPLATIMLGRNYLVNGKPWDQCTRTEVEEHLRGLRKLRLHLLSVKAGLATLDTDLLNAALQEK